MIIIDLDTVDFTPLLREGEEEVEMLKLRANKFVKIALKLYMGCPVSGSEIEQLQTARDFCISEVMKDEIRFK